MRGGRHGGMPPKPLKKTSIKEFFTILKVRSCVRLPFMRVSLRLCVCVCRALCGTALRPLHTHTLTAANKTSPKPVTLLLIDVGRPVTASTLSHLCVCVRASDRYVMLYVCCVQPYFVPKSWSGRFRAFVCYVALACSKIANILAPLQIGEAVDRLSQEDRRYDAWVPVLYYVRAAPDSLCTHLLTPPPLSARPR